MKERKFNRATIEVANNREIGGQVTADEMNRGLRTRNGRKLWLIACSSFLGSLMVAGLLVAVAPLPARADNDEDSRHEREDNDRGTRAEITALQAQVASLQATVSTRQGQLTIRRQRQRRRWATPQVGLTRS